MRSAPAQPSDMLLHIVATFLMPLFLGPASGNSDLAIARAAAMEALESCGIRDVIELITCAQFLAFSMASLGSICLSMADDLSLSMLLRLRGNANACSRTALQHRRALDEGRQKPAPAPAMDLQSLTVTPDLATEAAALMADVAKPRRTTLDPDLQARFERAERWAAQRAAMGTEPAEAEPATPQPAAPSDATRAPATLQPAMAAGATHKPPHASPLSNHPSQPAISPVQDRRNAMTWEATMAHLAAAPGIERSAAGPRAQAPGMISPTAPAQPPITAAAPASSPPAARP